MLELFRIYGALEVKGADKVSRELDNVDRKARSITGSIRNFGNRISSFGDKLTNKITKPAGIAASAITGLVTTLGFRRLVGMDNAQAKLQGLGIEGKRLDQVMKDVEGAVTGTTHTMAEGADVAAGALAAGIKEGRELERYIGLVGDAATASNRSMDEMAMIFNRVQGSGRLMTMELNQIEHGMPGFSQALAKHLGVPVEEMRNMVTEGKVTSEQFLDVMEDFAGGMSDAFAGTWQGMAKNVMANIGILGERMLSGLFQDSKKAMADFLEVLRSEDLRDWAEQTGVAIREFVLSMINGLKQAKAWWDSLSPSVQGVIQKIALFGSIGALSMGPFLQIVGRLISVFGTVTSVVARFGTGIASLANPVGLIITTIGALTAAFLYFFNTNEEFRERVLELWNNFKDTMINAWETFVGYITPAIEAVRDFVMEIWGGLVEWWSESGERIIKAAQNAWNFVSTIIQVAMDMIWAVMQFVWPFVEVLVKQVWGNIKGIIDGAIKVITGIIDAFASLLTGDWTGLWDAVKQIVSGALQFVWNLAQTWFIGRVLGVARNFGTMIGGVIRNAWNAVRGFFSSGLSGVRNLTSSGLSAVRNIFSRIFNALRGVVSRAFGRVRSAVSEGMTKAFNAVKNFFGNFKDAGSRIVTSIADGIKGAVGKVTDAIGGVVDKVRGFLPFSPAKEGPLKDLDKLDFEGPIGDSIERGENTLRDKMMKLLGSIHPTASINVGGRGVTTASNAQSATTVAKTQNNEMIELLKEMVQAIKDGKVINVDGRVLGEVTDEEQGKRVNLRGRVAY